MKLRRARFTFPLLLALAVLTGLGRAQGRNEWLEPFPSFTIAGNLHSVADKE